MDISSAEEPRCHLLSEASCQTLGRGALRLDLFFPDRAYSNGENGFHISHEDPGTITDSGVSARRDEGPPPPPSTCQGSRRRTSGPVWLKRRPALGEG